MDARRRPQEVFSKLPSHPTASRSVSEMSRNETRTGTTAFELDWRM